MFKKFLGLITILILIGIPVVGQEDSDPVLVNFTFQYESGISLTIVDLNIAWALIPLHIDPLTDESYIPSDNGPVDIVISYKLPVGHHPELICYTTELIYEDGTPSKNWNTYIHHEVSGEFVVAETPMPNPVDGNQTMWVGAGNGGKVVGQMEWKCWSHEDFGKTGVIYSGIATYVVLDIIT